MNTDQIAPVLHSRGLKEDYQAMLFHRARRREMAAKILISSSTSRSSAAPESW